MKRGITFLVTLVSVSLLYFGSLYFMSVSSHNCLTPIVNEKSELTNREHDIQVPLSPIQEGQKEYSRVDTKPTYNSTPLVNKEKAVIVVLVRNNELIPMRRTIREFEE